MPIAPTFSCPLDIRGNRSYTPSMTLLSSLRSRLYLGAPH
jgi:hypothetical protein